MQITKEHIIKILYENSDGFTVDQIPVRYVDADDFETVAYEILTLLHSNDAGQPNASKPDVSGSLAFFEQELKSVNNILKLKGLDKIEAVRHTAIKETLEKVLPLIRELSANDR